MGTGWEVFNGDWRGEGEWEGFADIVLGVATGLFLWMLRKTETGLDLAGLEHDELNWIVLPDARESKHVGVSSVRRI